MYSHKIFKKFNIKNYHLDPSHYTTIDIKQIKLDDFANENKIDNIDFLKIDTQGTEDKVLQGASELLKKQKIKVIQLELIFSEVYDNTLNFYDVEKLLIPNGYKLFAINKFGNLYHDIKFAIDVIYINQETKKLYYNNHPIWLKSSEKKLERGTHKPEVSGSIPLPATIFF